MDTVNLDLSKAFGRYLTRYLPRRRLMRKMEAKKLSAEVVI
jgi:hypothetical protein